MFSVFSACQSFSVYQCLSLEKNPSRWLTTGQLLSTRADPRKSEDASFYKGAIYIELVELNVAASDRCKNSDLMVGKFAFTVR